MVCVWWAGLWAEPKHIFLKQGRSNEVRAALFWCNFIIQFSNTHLTHFTAILSLLFAKKHFLSINGENSPWSCVIIMLFYEVRHFSRRRIFFFVKVCLWIFLLIRKQYLPKKNLALLAQKLGGTKSILIQQKKVAWTTKPLGVGAKP